MKNLTLATVLVTALTGAFSGQAQASDAAAKPAAPTLSKEQRATQAEASRDRFAAMSRQEKAANKGNKQRPTKPAAPTASQGRK